MFGTVARLKVRPGMRTVMLAWATYSEIAQQEAPGIVETVIFQTDANSQEVFMAVVFESREAYQRNAESADQHEQYVRMLEFLVSPPEWHDGEVLWIG